MDKQEIQRSAKPFIWGFAVGVAGLSIVAFGLDWVTMSSTAQAALKNGIQEAKVQQLATLCEDQARSYRATLSDAPDITGWQQRDARRELATRFAIIMPGQKAVDDAVVAACATRLDAA